MCRASHHPRRGARPAPGGWRCRAWCTRDREGCRRCGCGCRDVRRSPDSTGCRRRGPRSRVRARVQILRLIGPAQGRRACAFASSGELPRPLEGSERTRPSTRVSMDAGSRQAGLGSEQIGAACRRTPWPRHRGVLPSSSTRPRAWVAMALTSGPSTTSLSCWRRSATSLARARSERHRAAPGLRTSDAAWSAAISAARTAICAAVVRSPRDARSQASARAHRHRRCRRNRRSLRERRVLLVSAAALSPASADRHARGMRAWDGETHDRRSRTRPSLRAAPGSPAWMAAQQERKPTGEGPDGTREVGAFDHCCVVGRVGMLLRCDDLAAAAAAPGFAPGRETDRSEGRSRPTATRSRGVRSPHSRPARGGHVLCTRARPPTTAVGAASRATPVRQRRVARRHAHGGMCTVEERTGVGIDDHIERLAQHELGGIHLPELMAQHAGFTGGRGRTDEVGSGQVPGGAERIDSFLPAILLAQRLRRAGTPPRSRDRTRGQPEPAALPRRVPTTPSPGAPRRATARG